MDRIREAQAAGSKDIAILVQARKHLDLILPALRNEGIAFAAIELETLAQRLATRDLVTLTRAMTQPADRIAGFALLRAPWCGLELRDLLAVAEHTHGGAILDWIAEPGAAERLSPDGRKRVARLLAAIREPLMQRGRSPLARRVRAAWLALGGPACAAGALDVAGAHRFFALLSEREHAGDLADWDDFVAATGRLFAEASDTSGAVVQAMTLHKAKGLEFDTVILPGLDRPTGRNDELALRWKQREQGTEQRLLLAPLRAREGAQSEVDPIYRYLKSLDATESRAERGRLLYVGCTRAKRRLHLLAAPGLKVSGTGEPAQWRRPVQSSALAQLWPALGPDVAPPRLDDEAAGQDPGAPRDDLEYGAPDADEPEDGDPVIPSASPLRRLSLTWMPPKPAPSIPSEQREDDALALEVAFDWAHATAAAIGTVTHRLLAQVASDGLQVWDARDLASQRGRIAAELAHEGVPAEEREEATMRVESAVARTLADSRGRWLFDPSHAEARSEWALTGREGDTVRHVILDRTLIADGIRWIVDFKTGRHEGGAPDTYLDREVDRYRAQLEGYARIVRALDPQPMPIRLALYFPLVDGGWREWSYAG